MAIPKFEEFLYPFLYQLKDRNVSTEEMKNLLIGHFHLTADDCSLKTRSGNTLQLNDRIGWTRQWLRRALFIEIPQRGIYRITQRGKTYLQSHRDLRESDLMEYPEFADFSGRNKKKDKSVAKKIKKQTGAISAERNDNWLEIVETINPIVESKPPYSTYYNAVVGCFRLLGWKKSNGTISSDTPSDSADKEELFSLNIADGGMRIPIVPLVLNASYDNDSRCAKLFDAMKEWNCPVGLLFSDSVQLFFKNIKTGEPVCVSTVGFDEQNVLGDTLCNLFAFQQFDYGKLESFCVEQLKRVPVRPDLHDLIVRITKEPQLLTHVISSYLIHEGFEEEDIETELKKFSFKLKSKTVEGDTMSVGATKSQSDPRDNTKFSIDGGKTFYSKRIFVLNVIRQYVKEHPDVTIEDLEKVFPSSIISKTRGVVRPLSVVQGWVRERPDLAKRFFMSPDEVITLKDGMRVAIYNQWGTCFPKFLAIAKTLYNVTSDKPYLNAETVSETKEKPEPAKTRGIVISADSFSKFRTKK